MILGIISYTMFILYLFFGIYGFSLNKKSKVNIFFLFSCLTFAVWNLGYTFIFLENNIQNVKVWYRISSIGWTLLPYFTILFFIELTNKKNINKLWIKLILVIPSIIFLYLGLNGEIITKEFIKIGIGWYEKISYKTIWNILYSLYAFLYSIFGYFLVISWYRSTRILREKKQAISIIITGAIAILLSFPLNLIFPVIGIRTPCLAHIFSGIWAIGFIIAIIKYKFMLLTPELVASKIFSEMMDLLLLMNNNLEIIKVNKHFEIFSGYNENELIGKKIFNFIENIESDIGYRERKKGNILEKKETYLRTKNNNNIPISVSLSSVEDNAGDTIGYILVAHNLTSIKELEKLLKEKIAIENELIETNNILQMERNKLKQKNQQFELDLKLAHQIQMQHIPVSPPIDSLHFMYIPIETVGGDFFDFIKFNNSNKLCIFISDVSGHGISAAYITSMIKTSLHQMTNLMEKPSKYLNYINDFLFDKSGGNFITAFICVIDFDNLEMVYSNAGHNMPYIISNNKAFELRIDKNYMPLAVCTREELIGLSKTYNDHYMKLEKGSKLFLYTDGLSDTVNLFDLGNKEQVCFKDKYFPQIFIKYADLSPKSFLNNIYNDLVQFRGHDVFDDDICMICVEI